MIKHLTLASILLLAVSLVGCRDHGGSPTAPLLGGGTANDASVQAFVALVNAHRQSLGLNALIWDQTAADVAYAHSRDMATRGYFSHTTPEGLTPADRLSAAGVHFSEVGENIAFGYINAEAVFQAWMNSPDHRANIEYPGFTHHGVGRYGSYWTHVFYTPPRR